MTARSNTQLQYDICEAKHGGNEHSRAAFEKLSEHLNPARLDVLFAVSKTLDKGCTSKEAAEYLGKPLHAVSGRFTELKDGGWIERTGETRDGEAVWVATTFDEIKAYVVNTDYSEASVLVFAKTVSKAKALAKETEWLCDCDWTDLKCRREPKADDYGAEERALGYGVDDLRIIRDLGWHEVDGFDEVCSNCERHEWDNLPESILQESGDEYICTGCLEELNKNERKNHGVESITKS